VQRYEGIGFDYVSKIIKSLRKRIKIKEILEMYLREAVLEQPSKGYHLPGTYNRGRRKPSAPDYWEYGI